METSFSFCLVNYQPESLDLVIRCMMLLARGMLNFTRQCRSATCLPRRRRAPNTVLAALLRSMAPWIPRSADTIAQATRRGHVLIGSPDYDGPEFYMTAAVVAPNTRQATVFYIRTAKRLSAAINTAYYKAYAKSLEPVR